MRLSPVVKPASKRIFFPFALFLLLACLMMYRPLMHVGTHVPNDVLNDYFHFNWNYWWIRHALTTPGLNVYETNFVLFPHTTNLGYHTLMPFWFPLWAALEPFTGTLWAMQVIQILAATLTGWCFYLLLRRESVSYGLALVGGTLLQLTPSMFAAVLVTTPNYLNFFWLPAQLLLWGKLATTVGAGREAPQRHVLLWTVLQALALYGMVMTDSQYILYTAFLLIPYALWTLFQLRDGTTRIRLAGSGLLAVLMALALLWLAGPLPYMLAFDRSQLAPPSAEEAYRIPFPGGYFTRDMDYTNVITLGALVMPLFLLSTLASLTIQRGEVRDSRRWFWFWLALPPLILSAGASIMIGDLTIPMPYRLLHEALGGMLRSAHRFGTVFLIPALIFVGRTWTPVLARRPRLRMLVPTLLVLATFYDARLFWKMPMQPIIPPYQFYETIGREAGDYAVLEVPVAAGTGEIWVGEFQQLETQFYGITHGKRMVNGLISRAPISHFWYLRTDSPLLSWLGQRRFLEPEPARDELRRVIRDWTVGYLIVHQDLIGRNTPTAQEVIGWLNSQNDLLCPVWVEKDAIVYRTAWHPDGCPPRTPPESEPGTYLLDIGSPGDEKFIGWGWHWPEYMFGVSLRWTGEYPETEFYLDLPPGDYAVTVSAQSFWQPRQLRLLVNGEPVGDSVTVPVEPLTPFTFSVPADQIGDDQHITFTLAYDATLVPAEIGQSPDTRKLAVAVDWVRFTRKGD